MTKPQGEQLAHDADLEFAWRVHGALDSWTGKVDTKASIALALEAAIFGFVVTLTEEGRQLAGLDRGHEVLYYIGVGLLLPAMFFSLLVVFPQLGRRRARKIWRENMIFFGHLRHWEPPELSRALASGAPKRDQLAEQLVAMSKIAWRKHSALQWSLVLLVAAVASLLFAAS